MTAPLTIDARMEDAHTRCDQFLTKSLPQYSRSFIAKLIKAGDISCPERSIKASSLIVGDEHFVVRLPKVQGPHLLAENIALNIVYSDDHIAVINKEVGMVVHPGAGVHEGTLCHALLFHFPQMTVANIVRPGIVHRLDKHTSGLIVIAKTDEAHRQLSEAFKARRVQKIYRAICSGEIEQVRFQLKTGHMRHPHQRQRFYTRLMPPSESNTKKSWRLAHTDFEVLHTNFGLSSLRATLHTGRTHQIRAHLADINHPLLGDDLYEGRRPLKKSAPAELIAAAAALKGQALHAEVLAFDHPISHESLYFQADLPPQLKIIDEILGTSAKT